MIKKDRQAVSEIKRVIGKESGSLTWEDVDDFLRLRGSSLAELVEEVKRENGRRNSQGQSRWN